MKTVCQMLDRFPKCRDTFEGLQLLRVGWAARGTVSLRTPALVMSPRGSGPETMLQSSAGAQPFLNCAGDSQKGPNPSPSLPRKVREKSSPTSVLRADTPSYSHITGTRAAGIDLCFM